MTEIAKLIVSLSLSGSILILLLLLSRPLYRKRFGKSWQYYVWLVVILRLLLPITPEISLTGKLFLEAEQILSGMTAPALFLQDNKLSPVDNISQAETDDGQVVNIPQAETDDGQIGTIPDDMDGDRNDHVVPTTDTLPSATTQSDTANATVTKSDADQSIPVGTVLFALWLMVALLLLMRKITVYQSFRKYVDAGCRPLNDMKLLERFGHIVEENHIKGSIDPYTNSLVSSPLLIGLLRPRIILPDADLSECDFYHTVMHELIHYRRLDMLYKWLVQFTLCVHWFNPFVYLMKNEINRLCELSCDERVLKNLPENAHKSYGDTLLNAV